MKEKHVNKSKNLLLQTYITSLLSLVLCVTLFFGTTFAWFSSEIESSDNQIYVGTLAIELEHTPVSLKENKLTLGEFEKLENESVFAGVRWEPGHTQIEAFKIQNAGDLAFSYSLNLIPSDAQEENLEAIASQFEVYVGTDEKVLNAANITELKAADSGWQYAGTLLDIFNSSASVCEGVITDVVKDSTVNSEANQVVYIALHMKSDAEGDGIMGKTIGLNVKFVAYQQAYEEDSFGSGYDIAGTLHIKKGETVRLSGDMQPLKVVGEGTLELSNVTITAAEDGESALTILKGSDLQVKLLGENELTGAKNGSGIYVSEDATLTLSGETSASLTVTGNAGQEYLEGYEVYTTEETDASYSGTGGSGIGGKGTVTIKDVENVTALGYGAHGFGIGGEMASISIANTSIKEVKGGYAGSTEPVVGSESDKKYAKAEPEGGAAIGSSYQGAVISLDNVTIQKAVGGSKSAGIGAMFHTTVTINITDSEIASVTGGVSSAGIGGARIGRGTDTGLDDSYGDIYDATAQTVSINIKNSKITAQGGYYGAGIGSGYDTYCHYPEYAPMCSIEISGNSVITAAGGTYAAGIGTGYHAAGLSGQIETGVDVTAESGADYYKDSYTRAQAVGFGVIDPDRDGRNNTNTIYYNGVAVGVPSAASTQ